jgi:membrane-bound serine protease (ClpP class)
VGEIGTAETDLTPEGKVHVHGEYWNAVSETPIEKGSRVLVVGTINLKLKVRKIE